MVTDDVRYNMYNPNTSITTRALSLKYVAYNCDRRTRARLRTVPRPQRSQLRLALATLADAKLLHALTAAPALLPGVVHG